ncbi:MAG: hypothetical protein P8P30_07645 [Rickettsiales bacterium]|nr:hypothetical protein [Rickettsiales bacterium]
MEFEELTPPPPQMTQAQMQESFEPIQFAGSSIVLPDGCYRVFTSARDFIEVEASSAYEAMQKTDIRTPFKIERFSLSRMAVLTQEVLEENAANMLAAEIEAEGAKAASIDAASAEATVDKALPTEEEAEMRGLDGDEVDALLNNSGE